MWGTMTTVLVIAEDDSLRAAWSAAVVQAGHQCLAVPALLPGIDLLGTKNIDGLLVDARADSALRLLAAVSAYRPMPVTVIVHDRTVSIPARIRGVALRPGDASPERLVFLLGRLLGNRELANPTNLPVRVTAAALKWTSRLSSPRAAVEIDEDDSAEIRRQFDGETNPDGFELASR
jgi:DNA-binding NtrC family response regulator